MMPSNCGAGGRDNVEIADAHPPDTQTLRRSLGRHSDIQKEPKSHIPRLIVHPQGLKGKHPQTRNPTPYTLSALTP